LIATGDATGIVKVVRFDDGRVLGQLDAGEKSIESVIFSTDSKWIAVASMGGTVTIWSAVDMKMRHALQHPGGITSMKWHPTRMFVVTGCVDGAVRVWDIRNAELLSEMPGHEDVITCLDVKLVEGSEADLLIITGSDDRTVRLWQFLEKAPVKA
jgi:WD40 repeat protein